MKKILLFISVLIFFNSAKSQTNIYHPFPDSNAVWNFQMMMYCSMGANTHDFYSITFGNDTVIGLHTYHVLVTPFVNHTQQGVCVASENARGWIRQDTALRKVMILLPQDTVEQLLYDFNLAVGDTVRGYTSSWSGVPDLVQSIDSVLVGNDYRKRWIINPSYSISWIEGIGSSYGLINASPGNVTDWMDYSLTCFRQNGQTLYPDTTTDCAIIDAVKNYPVEKFTAIVTPNPFQSSTVLKIEGLNAEIKNSRLAIYNSLGMLVREEAVTNSAHIIYRGALPDGLYFFELLTSHSEPCRGKFIID